MAELEGEFPLLGLERIAERAEVRVASAGGLAGPIRGADVLSFWDFLSLEVAEALRGPHDLRWICVAATGVDKLLVPELVESSVVLTNAHGVFDRPIAEYVLTCIGALLKQLPMSLELQGLCEWNTRETRNLYGFEVLIVGEGGIGRATARLLSVAGMKVELMGLRERRDTELDLSLPSSDLAHYAGAVDVVDMAAPLTDRTENLLSESVIDRFRPGSYLVNVGRGRTVDQQALFRALATGRIAGAAIGTFQIKSLPIDDELWRLPNVFVSPHMSSRTEGWLAPDGSVLRQFTSMALRRNDDRDCRQRVGICQVNTSVRNQRPVLIALRTIVADFPCVEAPFERVDADAPWLSTTDLGLTRGDGIFESIGVFGGQPLELEAHLDRLSRSAEKFAPPYLNLNVFSAAILAAIDAHPRLRELLVKVIATRGVEGSGVPSAWVWATQNSDYTADRKSGVSAITLDRGYLHDLRDTAPWLLQGVKTLSYGVNQAALREAKWRGAREVVFISSDGYALEGPTSTLMIRDEEGFQCPPADFAVLPGTTQARSFPTLAQAGASVGYRAITLSDLRTASAIWLVLSGRLVVPVNLLAGVPVRIDSTATSLMQNALSL